jgi:four helix bundle protein
MNELVITPLFDFQKLEVYKKAQSFHMNCKSILKLTKAERYVADQLTRASYSIVLNIAEGSGRASAADRRNFFTIARASVYECVAISDMLIQEKQISGEQYLKHMEQASEISKMLFVMIRNLKV